MGSPFNIIIVTHDSGRAAGLANKCFALIDSFNILFSDYDPQSELNQVNNSAGKTAIKVSPGLMDIILLSKKAWQNSRHSFDITIGPLSQLWRGARKQKIFPDSSVIATTRKLVDFSQIVIDTLQQTVQLTKAGMRLDLGGIAKGYIAQKVIDFLRKQGISKALADAGGDMAMSSSANNSKGWVIGVNIPETTDDLLPRHLILQNIAVATSGDAYQYIEHNGKKYSHIIDPRTGYGIQSQRNVTVIAANGTDADWLAYARERGGTAYHMVGTCRMGVASDPMAVVDETLSVIGLEALRVVDASVMPQVPSANTLAATLMVAEKAADMILASR